MCATNPTTTEPVSVIIPTYNRRELLGLAIDSVLNQTYDNFELLVIDDGSDDGTDEFVASYGNKVRYLYQDNLGASAARNTGIRAARHDLLAFLDSDDQFTSEKLECQVSAMLREPDFLISHTDEIWYRRGKLLNQKNKHEREGGDVFQRSLEMCVIGMSTVMARREVFVMFGLFDESLPCCEDYDLWIRVSCKQSFLLVPEPLTIKDGGRDDQLSQIHRVGMDRFRIASIIKAIDSGGLSPGQDELARMELGRKCHIYGEGCLKHGREDEGRHYLDLAENYKRGN